jgi:hypothetical protein
MTKLSGWLRHALVIHLNMFVMLSPSMSTPRKLKRCLTTVGTFQLVPHIGCI